METCTAGVIARRVGWERFVDENVLAIAVRIMIARDLLRLRIKRLDASNSRSRAIEAAARVVGRRKDISRRIFPRSYRARCFIYIYFFFTHTRKWNILPS